MVAQYCDCTKRHFNEFCCVDFTLIKKTDLVKLRQKYF